MVNDFEMEMTSIPKDHLEASIPQGNTNLGFIDDKGNNLSESQNQNVEESTSPYAETGERDVWDKPIEFLLSIIAMSVGLGNVWRFPAIAYSNGGGAFLIPYLIVLVLIGRPIYYLEMCLGQFSRYGQVNAWCVFPMFKGIGYGTLVATICVGSYYCSIIAQVIFYLFASFEKTLPWKNCNTDWNSNGDGVDYCFENGTEKTGESSASLYYRLKAFPMKSNIDDGIGYPDGKLTLCLILTWTLIFLSIAKGVKSSGKVAYFTALFPYLVLLVLLIRGVTLPGAGDGIRYFFEPKWEKMGEVKVWYEAVGQMFFSLQTGYGTIIMFSSYNPFRHNIHRDAIIVSILDTFTSLLAGCTIFAVLGYLAHELDADISDVVSAGPGLVFIAYPTALAKFPVAQLFSVLFFLMLLTLGMGSATSLVSAITTVVYDKFPHWNRLLVTLAVCTLGFISGLLYVTPGGGFMIDLIDHFGASFVIYVLAMFEVIAICWGYGLFSFCKDVEFMLNIRVGWYYKITWGLFAPIALGVIFVYRMVTQDSLKGYPSSAIVCGWILVGLILLLLPLLAIHTIVMAEGRTITEKLLAALKPTRKWGPQDPELRDEWCQYKKTY